MAWRGGEFFIIVIVVVNTNFSINLKAPAGNLVGFHFPDHQHW